MGISSDGSGRKVAPRTRTVAAVRDGRHDFDFFFGGWQQESRKRVKFSFDDGATWDTNWTTRHARVA
jgi:hypothetical protein